MYSNDFKLTSSAVILAALLLAATDTKAGIIGEAPTFRLKTAANTLKPSDFETKKAPVSYAYATREKYAGLSASASRR